MDAHETDRSFEGELERTIAEFDRGAGDPCRVERVLKSSPAEVTQLVWLRLEGGGELGPYVRKVIADGAGIGSAWCDLADAERQGLRSANLPRVVSYVRRDGTLRVLMERVPGPTLRELVEGLSSEARPALAQRVMCQLCDAAATLHEGLGRPVIHRDITPSNVVCSGMRHDVAVLVDLGIARTWKAGAQTDTTHLGTRAYAAPEQFGFGQTDGRCDVYSLGLVAFFCLAGRDPSPGDREGGFASDGIDEGWRQVIARAASFDPAERYASARELKNAIESLAPDPAASGRGMVTEVRRANPTRGLSRLDMVAGVLRRLWGSRNVVIVPVTGLFAAVCVSLAFDPGRTLQGPRWFSVFSYLIYMNYLVLLIGYLAMDKRWLRAHVRFLRDRTFWQDLRLGLAIFAALTVAFIVFSGMTG